MGIEQEQVFTEMGGPLKQSHAITEPSKAWDSPQAWKAPLHHRGSQSQAWDPGSSLTQIGGIQ